MKQENSLRDTFLLGGDRFTLPKCVFCKNFIDGEDGDGMVCEAFPKGIPDNVLWEPEEKECNNGIKFEEDE